jgi:pilus assembly protein CpaE
MNVVNPVIQQRPTIVVSFDDAYATRFIRAVEHVSPTVHVTPLLRTLLSSIESLEPTVAVFDLQTIKTEEHSIFDIMASVSETYPNIRKIALGHQNLPAQVISAMKAGAVDFLDRDASADELAQAVISQLRQARVAQHDRSGRVFALVGACENETESEVASNIASLVAAEHKIDDVLLLDLNLENSQLEIEFDVEITYSVRDALDELMRLDKSILMKVLARHSCGVYLLPLTTKTRKEDEISPQELATLLGALRSFFSVIIVKAGCLRDKYCQSYLLPFCDRVMIVCPQLLGSLREARDIASEGPIKTEFANKFSLIVSRYDPDIDLTPQQMSARTGLLLVGTVPRAWVDLANSHNEGVPLVLSAGGSRYSKSIRSITQLLFAEEAEAKTSNKPAGAGRLMEWFTGVKRVSA